jgi:hypothetical protein
MYRAASSPVKQLMVVPNAGHGDAFQKDRTGYLDAVFTFFRTAIPAR